jgi:hypothetical protein
MSQSFNSQGYPQSKLPERTAFVKLANGTIYSIDIAHRKGIVDRDRDVEGNLFVEQVSLPAKSWLEAGTMDQAAVDYMATVENHRQAAPVFSVDTRRASNKTPPVHPDAPESRIVDALLAFLESSMSEDKRDELAHALRVNVRRLCGMSR